MGAGEGEKVIDPDTVKVNAGEDESAPVDDTEEEVHWLAVGEKTLVKLCE